MAARLTHLVIDAADPLGLARFWSTALQRPIMTDESCAVHAGRRPDGQDRG